ncbi:MAG: hypothetical protein M3044_05540 [Thermoproteota archaeon]|nr:hypothetical protein [Thermoproteota archaeon]
MTKFKVCISSCRPVGAIMKIANRNFRRSTITIIATTTSIIVQRVLSTILIIPPYPVFCLLLSYREPTQLSNYGLPRLIWEGSQLMHHGNDTQLIPQTIGFLATLVEIPRTQLPHHCSELL